VPVEEGESSALYQQLSAFKDELPKLEKWFSRFNNFKVLTPPLPIRLLSLFSLRPVILSEISYLNRERNRFLVSANPPFLPLFSRSPVFLFISSVFNFLLFVLLFFSL
jgi:hypothetical protein